MAAETKKSKVDTATFNREWKGGKGTIYYFDLTFENGDSGQYGGQSQEQTKFVIGVETEYTIEQKENARGSYHQIKPIYEQRGGGYGGRQHESPHNKLVTMAMAYTKDLVVAGKVDLMDMSKYYNKIYKAMSEKLV